jgi:LPPG:FO 2-phospho-L-lactate transferase
MTEHKIVALAGGVGGAKLADGLAQVLHPSALTIIVNTGDDFSHMGLRISPDLDTICYTLAGIANSSTGWGRRDETWNVLNALKKLDMPDWFQIGDTDFATHLTRSFKIKEGMRLSQITQEFCEIWGVKVKVLPMSDDTVQTWIRTFDSYLAFQEYFVHRHCEPIVQGFKFEGADIAEPAPGVMEALEACDTAIICPSNPWVSIDPILAVKPIRSELDKHKIVAVSPIIGHQAIKGPAAKMFSELGIEPTPLAVAQHYQQLIDTLFVDSIDFQQVEQIEQLGIHAHVTDILMKDKADRGRLAGEIIEYIALANQRYSQ